RGAWHRGSPFDRVSTAVCNTLYAMPDFWLGMVLLIAFASKIAIFPTAGMHNPDGGGAGLAGAGDLLWHLALPCLVLTLVYLAECGPAVLHRAGRAGLAGAGGRVPAVLRRGDHREPDRGPAADRVRPAGACRMTAPPATAPAPAPPSARQLSWARRRRALAAF